GSNNNNIQFNVSAGNGGGGVFIQPRPQRYTHQKKKNHKNRRGQQPPGGGGARNTPGAGKHPPPLHFRPPARGPCSSGGCAPPARGGRGCPLPHPPPPIRGRLRCPRPRPSFSTPP